MASTACHYAVSMNHAWLGLWNNQLTQYMEIPERLTDAQTDFIEQAFDHYQESVHQLSGIARRLRNRRRVRCGQPRRTARARCAKRKRRANAPCSSSATKPGKERRAPAQRKRAGLKAVPNSTARTEVKAELASAMNEGCSPSPQPSSALHICVPAGSVLLPSVAPVLAHRASRRAGHYFRKKQRGAENSHSQEQKSHR